MSQTASQTGLDRPRFAWSSRFSRWLLVRSLAFAPEQLGIPEGLRAAIAVGAMVVAAQLLGRPIFCWGAIAAFWTCLADPGGPTRLRLRILSGFVAAGTMIMGLMSWVAGLGPMVAAPVLFAVVLLCGMAQLLGTEANLAGVLASVVAVVAVDQPSTPGAAANLAGILLGCGLFTIIFCIAIWRIHPHRPARRAIVAMFRELGHMAADLEQASRGHCGTIAGLVSAAHRGAIRDMIERARARVEQVAAGRDDAPVRRSLLAVIAAADSIFAGLVALEHELPNGSETGPALLELRRAMALSGTLAARPDADWTTLRPAANALSRQAESSAGLTARLAAHWAQAIGALAQPVRRDGAQDTVATVPPARAHAVRAAFRHAARVATVVLGAFLITDWFALPYGYWAMMAATVVMQPRATTTWPRMLERVVGSITGGLVAAALTLTLRGPWDIVLIVFPLATATIALRPVNYALFVFFLTPLFVLVAELIAPGQGIGLAAARTADNVLGSVLCLAGNLLLWPEREATPFPGMLISAVEANLHYAAAATGPRDATALVELARRQAGIASNRAEEALLRGAIEGRMRRIERDQAQALLASLRQLAGASAAAWLSGAPAAHAARYATLGRALAMHLRDGPAFDFNLLGGLDPTDELDEAVAKTAGLVLRQGAARLREKKATGA